MTENEKAVFELLQRIKIEEDYIEEVEQDIKNLMDKVNMKNLAINNSYKLLEEIRTVLAKKHI